MYLEKCPSIIGRSSELKNPLQSGDTSPKVAQKVRRALAQCCADDFFFFSGLKKKALAQDAFYILSMLFSVSK